MRGLLQFQPWRQGKRLRPGDSVAVIAPSGPVPRERYERGLGVLSARYRVEDSPGVLERYGFLAGNDGRRLSALRWALSSPQSRAVFCGRGGTASRPRSALSQPRNRPCQPSTMALG